MLHEPDRHEPLQALPWDEGRVRAAIDRIVAGTELAHAERAVVGGRDPVPERRVHRRGFNAGAGRARRAGRRRAG